MLPGLLLFYQHNYCYFTWQVKINICVKSFHVHVQLIVPIVQYLPLQ